MNFLALTQRLRLEVGIAGSGPITTVGQTGEMGRLVAWINQAWMDIQATRKDWGFLRKSTSFATSDGVYNYTAAAAGAPDLGLWDLETFRSYSTSVGLTSEIMMDWDQYDSWRDQYLINANRNVRTRPMVVSVKPSDKSLNLGPVPAAGYTITADYFAVPSELSGDTATPVLPVEYHMAIVEKAKMYYGAYESAPEVFNQGQAEFTKWMRRLATDYLPPINFAGTLA